MKCARSGIGSVTGDLTYDKWIIYFSCMASRHLLIPRVAAVESLRLFPYHAKHGKAISLTTPFTRRWAGLSADLREIAILSGAAAGAPPPGIIWLVIFDHIPLL
jgi:hypothetical protein